MSVIGSTIIGFLAGVDCPLDHAGQEPFARGPEFEGPRFEVFLRLPMARLAIVLLS